MKAKVPITLGVVLLDYKTPERTIAFFNDTLSKIKISHASVIVNNTRSKIIHRLLVSKTGSVDANVYPKGSQKKNRFVLTTGQNEGYARGNSKGIEFLLRNYDCQYLLVLNNDLEITDIHQILLKLIGVANERKDIGIIGPTIQNDRGIDQNPFIGLNIGTYTLRNALNPFFMLIKILNRKFDQPALQNAPSGYYPHVSGCFMVIRANAYVQSGGFDKNTFLYAEEAILSERMKNAGFKSFYQETPPIRHKEGLTIDLFVNTESKLTINNASIMYYFEKYTQASKTELRLCKASFWLYLRVYLKMYKLMLKILKVFYRTSIKTKFTRWAE
jgi:GT2 family glycosyltransferase